MRCGDCGHNMHFHVNSKNPDIHFFACSNSKVDKRGTPKTQFGDLTGFIIADKNVPAEEIKSIVGAVLRKSVPVKSMKSRGLQSANISVRIEKPVKKGRTGPAG